LLPCLLHSFSRALPCYFPSLFQLCFWCLPHAVCFYQNGHDSSPLNYPGVWLGLGSEVMRGRIVRHG
jgi:hypothetical protein